LSKAHVLLAIQDDEAAILRELVPTAEVICTPFAVRPRPVANNPVPGRCLFVASRAPHNVHGLRWFLAEVWPAILAAAPSASLHVCGSVGEAFGGDYPNVQWLGQVDDLAREYGSAQVCLAPLSVGSGLKIKLVEALAYGRAAVSTSAGLQGLQPFAGRAVLVADTAADFAGAVVRLLNDADLRHAHEEQARTLAAIWLSPERCYQPFVDRIWRASRETRAAVLESAV
jgi:glycosyltransferase involved in cell wall biosynthesis